MPITGSDAPMSARDAAAHASPKPAKCGRRFRPAGPARVATCDASGAPIAWMSLASVARRTASAETGFFGNGGRRAMAVPANGSVLAAPPAPHGEHGRFVPDTGLQQPAGGDRRMVAAAQRAERA